MDSETTATFFALLLISGGAALVLVAAIGGPVRTAVGTYGVPLAFLVAAGATGGSLYFSEVADFVPCEMCWYQRIAMYPLAPLLLIAAVTKDDRIARYVLPIVLVGAGLSIYHVQLQLFPEQSTSCSLDAPCTAKWVEVLGFVTIPWMALFSFVLVLALTGAAHLTSTHPKEPSP